MRAYFWAALAGRAVALNGRQPPRKVLEGIIRNAHLRLFASHLHRQITSHFAHIGHAAAEAAALPATAAHIYFLRSYQPPHIWQYGKKRTSATPEMEILAPL